MNNLKKSLALVLAFCLAVTSVACDNGEEKMEEGIKAKVNDKVITQQEYDEHIAIYKKMAENQYGDGAWDMEISEGQTIGNYYETNLLDQLITDLLLVDAAEKEGITITDEELQGELDDFKKYLETDEKYEEFLTNYNMSEEYLKNSLKDEYIINHYLSAKIENIEPTDQELETLFKDLRSNEKVRASHILVDTEEEANAVIDRLNNGESFEDLAKELSKDTGSAENGGDLDYFKYTDMVQPFSEAAFNMEVGEISKPVQSEYGYHVIKVTDKKVDDTVTLETEKSTLTEYYKSMKYEELLEELKSEADIDK